MCCVQVASPLEDEWSFYSCPVFSLRPRTIEQPLSGTWLVTVTKTKRGRGELCTRSLSLYPERHKYLFTHFFTVFKKYLFIWLFWILVATCGIKFPNQVSNPGLCVLGAQSLKHWCMHAKLLQSCLTLWHPMDYIAHQAPLSTGFSRQEYWSGFPCPPPEYLPNPRIEQESLTSAALADGFSTTSAIWEAH